MIFMKSKKQKDRSTLRNSTGKHKWGKLFRESPGQHREIALLYSRTLAACLNTNPPDDASELNEDRLELFQNKLKQPTSI